VTFEFSLAAQQKHFFLFSKKQHSFAMHAITFKVESLKRNVDLNVGEGNESERIRE
jgi:hypothetical protein